MTHQPGSDRFQALLESALQEYEKQAGVRLTDRKDSIAIQELQLCHNIGDVATLLQVKTQAFNDFQQRDRIIRSIRATVSILTPISTVASVADDAGLVRQKVLNACLAFLTFFSQKLLPHATAIHSTLGVILGVSTIPKFIPRHPSDVQVNQAANSVITSFDALAEMLESIENFITRLSLYVEMPHSTPALEKTVVKLMVELISTLALVTRKLEKRRSRESSLTNMFLYSARRSQMGKEFFRGQGYQQSTSEA